MSQQLYYFNEIKLYFKDEKGDEKFCFIGESLMKTLNKNQLKTEDCFYFLRFEKITSWIVSLNVL